MKVKMMMSMFMFVISHSSPCVPTYESTFLISICFLHCQMFLLFSFSHEKFHIQFWWIHKHWNFNWGSHQWAKWLSFLTLSSQVKAYPNSLDSPKLGNFFYHSLFPNSNVHYPCNLPMKVDFWHFKPSWWWRRFFIQSSRVHHPCCSIKVFP
jgi:hypothetical protein